MSSNAVDQFGRHFPAREARGHLRAPLGLVGTVPITPETIMSLHGTYDADNIFAKIIRGEVPAAKVFEDDQVLAFMDVFPQSRGHVLVISKTSQARNLLEAETKTLGRLIGAVQKVTQAVTTALKPDGVVVTQFNGAPAGQTIFHLHFHIIPRYEGEALGRHGEGMADAEELRRLAEKIAAAL
ncbi:hydrolase [Caulobacter rhizosphaerae]|nr:hydrolase [Caulobacter rhizosphaerae]